MQTSSLVKLGISASSVFFLSTAYAQSVQTTPIYTSQQAIGAQVNFINASNDVYNNSWQMTNKAEAIGINMLGDGKVIIPSPSAKKTPNVKTPNTLTGETIWRAFQWIKNSGFSSSPLVQACDGGGNYTAQLDNQGGQYLLSLNYSVCRKNAYSSAFEIDGPISVRFQMDATGKIRLSSVKFGKNYQQPNAIDYVEKVIWLPPEYAYTGVVSTERSNFEVNGNFLSAMVAGTDWTQPNGQGSFSYQYNGLYYMTWQEIQTPNGTVPTPVVWAITADNMFTQGTFISRLPNESKSFTDISYRQGKLKIYAKSDFLDGERTYSVANFGLTNMSPSPFTGPSLNEWKVRGTFTVSNAPWNIACGNGTYYVDGGMLVSSAPTSGQVDINKNLKVRYDNGTVLLSLDGGSWFEGQNYVGCQPF